MPTTGNAQALQPNEQIVEISRSHEFQDYDNLPPKFRTLVNEAPIKQHVGQIWEGIERFGAEAAYEMICQFWETHYPGWTRPKC